MSKTRITVAKLSLAALTLVLPFTSAYAQETVVPLTEAQLLSQLDADMRKVIEIFDIIKGTPAIDLTPQDARQQFSAQDAAKILARSTGASEAPLKIGKVTDGLTAEGRHGVQIPLRLYTPEGAGPFPVIVYYHGGGFVIATIDTYDASARYLCKYANAIVVSVEYRKAPEHPYPAALEDANDAYRWVIHHIDRYDGIATEVALAGESAGGNLATEVAIEARDQGLQRPTHELLIYPVTSSNVAQPSDILYENAVPLSTPLLKYFFKYYVPNASEANDPGVAPIETPSLRNLPPTTIIAADEDPLKSDGIAYYAKLKASGNQVTYRLFSGTTHEFFGMGDVVAKAKQAEMFGAAQLAASFK